MKNQVARLRHGSVLKFSKCSLGTRQIDFVAKGDVCLSEGSQQFLGFLERWVEKRYNF